MAAKTSLSQFEPFFGGDKKGAYLVQAMFNGTNYEQRTDLACLMTELMKAENYKSYQSVRSVNGVAQAPNDVPQDVTDLIITTALYHRAIDTTQGVGIQYAKLEQDAPKKIQEHFKQSLDYVRAFPNSLVNPGNNIVSVYNITTNAELFLYLLADKALSEQVPAPAGAVPAFVDTILNGPLVWVGLSASFGPAETQIKDRIKIVLVKLITDMGKVMKDENPILNQNVATVKDFVLDKGDDYLSEFYGKIREAIRSGIKNYERHTGRGPAVTAYSTVYENTPKEFFDKVYGKWSELSPDVRQFYLQNVGLFAKRSSSNLFDPAVRAVRDRGQQFETEWVRMADAEVDKLFANNRTLTDDERKNLRVNLMKSKSSGYTEILFGANLPDVKGGVNIWYTNNDNQANFVPSPPADFLRQLYVTVYTTPLASPATINVVYTSSGTPPIASTHPLNNVKTDLKSRPLDMFNIDIGKFVSSAIKCEDKLRADKHPSAPTTKPKPGKLDYPFLKAFDMVYGKLWTYDESKDMYYRLDESGKKCWYNDEAKSDTKTCYATYLGQGDKTGVKCERIIKCIADGNYQSLHRCLDVIGDEGDLWEVAADDVAKVGPDMVRLVLRKFRVKGVWDNDSKGVKYLVPITFERWMRDVVEEKDTKKGGYEESVRNAIKKNDNLLNYIRGLINVCRANPSIINKTNVSITKRDKTPDYFKNLYPHIKPFRFPHIDKKTSEYELIAKMMTDTMMPNYPANRGLFNPITSGYFSNVSMMSPYSTQFPGMLGGTMGVVTPVLPSSGTSIENMNRQGRIVKRGSSNQFGSLIATIGDAFNDVGLQLHPDDQAKLLGVVKKLENYEDQLARMCTILIGIVQIARFFGVSLENVDRDHPTQMRELNKFQTVDEIQAFVRNYARELHKNMINNVNIQQGVSHELMGKVFPRLWCEAAGKTGTDATSGTTTTAGEPAMVDF